MTTDSEQRLRALLHDAAPEPRRTFDAASIRQDANGLPGEVVPLRRRAGGTTLSVVLAVAAVVAVALVAVGLTHQGRGPVAPAGPGVRHDRTAAPSTGTTTTTTAGPATCASDAIELRRGAFVSGSAARAGLIISDRVHKPCTVRSLPTIQLTVDGAVTSVLRTAQYAAGRSVVLRPSHPTRIVATLRRTQRCSGGHTAQKTEIGYVLGSFTYGFDLPTKVCGYSIRSATVGSG